MGPMAAEGRKERIGFYTSPSFAAQVRESCFDHRLTLQEFFEAAGEAYMERLRTEGAQKQTKRLPRGRPIRPKDDEQ